jgi:hypothetical protein
MGLGVRRSPEGYSSTEAGGEPADLELAKQNIDLLELMQEKTSGNLTPDEARLLQQLLFETRMHFIEAAKSTRKGV